MHRRLRPLKWIALALSVGVIVASVATTSRCVAWIGGSAAVGFGEGVVWWKTRWVTAPAYLGWHIGQSGDGGQSWLFQVPSRPNAFFGLSRSTAYTHEVSFRTVLLALIPLTALLWWGDIRRRPPYLCRVCRYDMRGVRHSAGGHLTCPECGAAHV